MSLAVLKQMCGCLAGQKMTALPEKKKNPAAQIFIRKLKKAAYRVISQQ